MFILRKVKMLNNLRWSLYGLLQHFCTKTKLGVLFIVQNKRNSKKAKVSRYAWKYNKWSLQHKSFTAFCKQINLQIFDRFHFKVQVVRHEIGSVLTSTLQLSRAACPSRRFCEHRSCAQLSLMNCLFVGKCSCFIKYCFMFCDSTNSFNIIFCLWSCFILFITLLIEK